MVFHAVFDVSAASSVALVFRSVSEECVGVDYYSVVVVVVDWALVGSVVLVEVHFVPCLVVEYHYYSFASPSTRLAKHVDQTLFQEDNSTRQIGKAAGFQQ